MAYVRLGADQTGHCYSQGGNSQAMPQLFCVRERRTLHGHAVTTGANSARRWAAGTAPLLTTGCWGGERARLLSLANSWKAELVNLARGLLQKGQFHQSFELRTAY